MAEFRAGAAAAAARRTAACGRVRGRLFSPSVGDTSHGEQRLLTTGSKGGESGEPVGINRLKSDMNLKGSKCSTEGDMKFILMEKNLAELKCAFQLQSKYIWYAVGLITTLIASTPAAAQVMIERNKFLDEKQKIQEKKYRLLQSRIGVLEAQLAIYKAPES